MAGIDVRGPEAEIQRLLTIGYEHAGQQDSIPLVRLLIAEAFLPFAYGPLRGTSDEAVASSQAKACRPRRWRNDSAASTWHRRPWMARALDR